MSNTEWNERLPGAYPVWGEDVHPHHTFEEEETMEEEYDEETTEEEGYSFYEEMIADSLIHDVSLAVDTMKLSLSAPRLTIAEGVPVTFNYSDKATIAQEVTDGQLSLTVQENTTLQSIKICVNNRTWTIPFDAFLISPPSMPKKR